MWPVFSDEGAVLWFYLHELLCRCYLFIRINLTSGLYTYLPLFFVAMSRRQINSIHSTAKRCQDFSPQITSSRLPITSYCSSRQKKPWHFFAPANGVAKVMFLVASVFPRGGRVRVFSMPQVPFAFEFESERPNCNLVTKQSLNCHSADLKKSAES